MRERCAVRTSAAAPLTSFAALSAASFICEPTSTIRSHRQQQLAANLISDFFLLAWSKTLTCMIGATAGRETVGTAPRIMAEPSIKEAEAETIAVSIVTENVAGRGLRGILLEEPDEAHLNPISSDRKPPGLPFIVLNTPHRSRRSRPQHSGFSGQGVGGRTTTPWGRGGLAWAGGLGRRVAGAERRRVHVM